MWKPAVLVLGFVALLAWLLVATHGKDCHFNVHLEKRLYCTERAR